MIGAGLFWGICPGTAGAASALKPLPEFSPPEVKLEWSAEGVQDPSFTVFYRTMNENAPGPWEAAPGIRDTTATSGTFPGIHGQRIEFRCAITSATGAEMVRLGDFDEGQDLFRVWPACSVAGNHMRIRFDEESYFQGRGSLRTSFTFDNPGVELTEKDLLGVRFTDKIPTMDWSPFRFLEFYYWSDIPGGADLLIKSASADFREPVAHFTEDAKIADQQWQFMTVDLNEKMGPPENRSKITAVAVAKNLQGMDLKRGFMIRLDGVRLWRERPVFHTTIDGTPPPPPKDLEYELKSREIVWSWKPPEDPESGIEGYWYTFTNDPRKAIPGGVLAASASAAIPYVKPPRYEEMYFFAAARNRAGLWSPLAERKVVFKP